MQQSPTTVTRGSITPLDTYAYLWPTAEDRTSKAAESIISASLGGSTGALVKLGTSPAE